MVAFVTVVWSILFGCWLLRQLDAWFRNEQVGTVDHQQLLLHRALAGKHMYQLMRDTRISAPPMYATEDDNYMETKPRRIDSAQSKRKSL